MDDAVLFAGAAAQAALIARGELTSEALTRACLDRIADLDGRLHAFSHVLGRSALAEARQADSVPADKRGALHGVPIAIKEELDVAGTVTTFGGRANSSPAESDGEVVRRLREAGAVILGKTNMPEFGQWPFTESTATGLTRNPWNPSLSPGGSSGGTAVAVASGMVGAGIGGDGGGSIRIPAAACGLFGLKPSRGRVSTAPHAHLWWALGTVGPLSRTVADSALIYDVISGSVPTDLYAAPPLAASLAHAATVDPEGLRIGWSTKSPTRGVRPSPEIVNSVKVMARKLADLGHDVREIEPHYPDATLAFVPQFFGGVRSEAFEVEHFDELESRTKQTVRLGSWARPAVVRAAIRAGDILGRKVQRTFDDVDVLLTPTIPATAPKVPALRGNTVVEALFKAIRMVSYTAIWNVTGNPAASVPFGFSASGLPLAVQLVGRRFDEATLISLAAQIERAHPWADRRPN